MSSLSLVDIATSIDMLEVRCSRCDRKGRLSVARLIDQHGGDTKLVDLRRQLVGNCDKASALDYERCDIFFPQLRGAGGPTPYLR